MPLAITNTNTDHVSMRVFPNPASNIVTVELDAPVASNGTGVLETLKGLSKQILKDLKGQP